MCWPVAAARKAMFQSIFDSVEILSWRLANFGGPGGVPPVQYRGKAQEGRSRVPSGAGVACFQGAATLTSTAGMYGAKLSCTGKGTAD